MLLEQVLQSAAVEGPDFLFDFIKLIFDSERNQVIDRAGKSAARRGRGTTKQNGCVDQAFATWWSVGGRATPRAESARLAPERGTSA